MRLSEKVPDQTSLYIDESASVSKPESEPIYAEIIKNKFNNEKETLKRASWSPAEYQECGLPPTGKRIDTDHSIGNKTSNRVRMRSRPTRTYQLQQPQSIFPTRPLSFNEKYDQTSNRTSNLLTEQRQPTSTVDTLLQITTCTSPSLDNSDFLSDRSNTSSPQINLSDNHFNSSTKTRPLLNAYKKSSSTNEFTSQIPIIDSSLDESCHSTTRNLMTRSMSSDHQNNGLKHSTSLKNSCLKKTIHRTKKSVHFDCQPPAEIENVSNMIQPSVIVTNDEEKKKKSDGETVKEKERRTNPLTTHIVHRSFSLSPSPLSKEENSHNRRHHRQVKKVNVDELNSIPTSRRVTFNENISPTKKSNGMNNFNESDQLTQPMALHTFLMKTTSFNSEKLPKKCPTSNGLLNFINPSTQRKSKRLSADIDSLANIDIDKVTINCQKDSQLTIDNNSSNTDSFNLQNTKRSSISMSTNTIKSNEGDSLNNGLLFQPIKRKESFYLSPPKSMDEPSAGMMQTSTLIISTPPQYHYYLYPPSISKKNSRTNVSMNSISTNSTSSSSSSCEYDDESLSYSFYPKSNQSTKPVILSDSVQNFWPPPPSPSQLNNDPEQIIMASTIEQNKKSSSKIRQQQQHFQSTTYNDDSSSMSNSYKINVSPPLHSTSLMLNKKDDDVRSYSEQNSFSNGCLRIESDSSLEDTQASYSERLREKSRLIKQPVAMNSNYSRSRSKDPEQFHTINRTMLRPKSASQTHIRQEISNDFQSKRQFFENQTYSDYPPTPTQNKIYPNERHMTKQPLPPLPPQPESMIRTTKYFDAPTIYQKPVRIVKAVQRSVPPKINYETNIHLSSEYMRNLFPKSDRYRQNSGNRQSEDLLLNDRRNINNEIEINNLLGTKLIKIIESQAEVNEIEKIKLHINEIETITSVFLKLSYRLAKVENDLMTLTDDNTHAKTSLLEQRDKIQQKHDEAKSLKDGIDRRSRLVTTILRKYLSQEQFNDFEHFIRMKSILLMDEKDIEENLTFLQKQILLNTSSNNSQFEYSQTNFSKPISTTA